MAHLPRHELPAGLAARTLATVERRSGAPLATPAWWRGLLGIGVVAALALCFWVIAGAVTAFEGAGGGELLDLIGSYPHLVWQHPADAALALLEALPVANLAIALASALLACLLGAQLVAMATLLSGRPRFSGRP